MIVPIDGYPPGLSLTLQATRWSATPFTVAENCRALLITITTLAGEMVIPRIEINSDETALPDGVITWMNPEMAFVGISIVSVQVAAYNTVAAIPPIVTWFSLTTLLKPIPKICTWSPAIPPVGVTSVIATGVVASFRRIARMFPTAS